MQSPNAPEASRAGRDRGFVGLCRKRGQPGRGSSPSIACSEARRGQRRTRRVSARSPRSSSSRHSARRTTPIHRLPPDALPQAARVSRPSGGPEPELMLKIFSRDGLRRIFVAAEAELAQRPASQPASEHSQRVLAMQARYVSLSEDVIRFLQGRLNSLAYRMCHPGFLPRGKHFELNKGFDSFDGAGTTIAVHDRAKFVGTLFLYDIAEVIRELIFPYFQITLVDRYYDDFGASLHHLRAHGGRAGAPSQRHRRHAARVLRRALRHRQARPRRRYRAVRAQPLLRIPHRSPRQSSCRRPPRWRWAAASSTPACASRRDARVFNYVDFITLDDGEKPILNLVEHLAGKALDPTPQAHLASARRRHVLR